MVLKFTWVVFDQRWDRLYFCCGPTALTSLEETETSPSFVFPSDVSAVGPQQK